MHIEEAQWIAEQLCSLPGREVSPLLNIGSSTAEYRVRQQPHIDELIFKPLRQAHVEVVHQDIKAAPGVDLIGDLADPSFLDRLQGMRFRAVLCSNLLEHLVNRREVIEALLRITPVGGYLVVTVPSCYPKHMDPIDTMFRPTPEELAGMFQNTRAMESALVDVGTIWSTISRNPKELLRLVARIVFPFYKTYGWITAYNRVLWMFRTRTIACVLLKKIA